LVTKERVPLADDRKNDHSAAENDPITANELQEKNQAGEGDLTIDFDQF
jgi:hypothetical protein